MLQKATFHGSMNFIFQMKVRFAFLFYVLIIDFDKKKICVRSLFRIVHYIVVLYRYFLYHNKQDTRSYDTVKYTFQSENERRININIYAKINYGWRMFVVSFVGQPGKNRKDDEW